MIRMPAGSFCKNIYLPHGYMNMLLTASPVISMSVMCYCMSLLSLEGCNGSSVLILYVILILICNGIWPLTRLIWKNNTGTDHPIAHLYDVNTFQCYLSANVPEISVNGAINQVWSKTYFSQYDMLSIFIY